MKSEAIVELGKPLQTIESETPEPKGKEVLLKITHSGVCHSDVHIHDGYFDLGGGNQLPLGGTMNLPHTLGHEIEGEVIAMGADVPKGLRKVNHMQSSLGWDVRKTLVYIVVQKINTIIANHAIVKSL